MSLIEPSMANITADGVSGLAARGKSHSGCERVFCPGSIVANTRQIYGFACVLLLAPEQNPALSPTKHFCLTTDC